MALQGEERGREDNGQTYGRKSGDTGADQLRQEQSKNIGRGDIKNRGATIHICENANIGENERCEQGKR